MNGTSSLAFLALLVTGFGTSIHAKDAPESSSPKSCPLCKFQGRAALFSGVNTAACPADCAKLCCKGSEISYFVPSIKSPDRAATLRAAFEKMKLVEIASVSSEAGRLVVRYDPSTLDSSELATAIEKAGFPVNGSQTTFSIPTMKDDAAASAVEKALVLNPGVTKIETVCSKNCAAVVTFDPAKTTRANLAAAIAAAGFKTS